MAIGKIIDNTIKETPNPSRWAQYDAPQAPAAPAPVTHAVPDKYRQAAASQQTAEDNVYRVLAGVPAEVAGEVIRRVQTDAYFTADERQGLDADAKAYHFHLQKIRRELGGA